MSHAVLEARIGAWQHELAGGLRKRPLQARSRAAIQRILETAEELVVEVGHEAVVDSPTLLLDRSGVSRGSFYAFFESPERVLDELAYRGIQQSIAGFRVALDERKDRSWRGVIDQALEFYAAEHRTPLIRELWVRQHLSQRIRELDYLAIEEFARIMLSAFRSSSPGFDGLSEVECRVTMHTLERLFQFAFLDDPDGDFRVIAETRRMLTNYFASYEQAT